MSPADLRRSPSFSLRAFMREEVTGGLALMGATAAALAWANSPWRASYQTVWSTELSFGLGRHVLTGDLQRWINEALMTVFFFVVGLEVKREATTGELRQWRMAALPVFAAVGGMVVPAALYGVPNSGGPGAHGWGVPMATDLAFALGVAALLGRRVPASLKVFLLTLAVVDDVGAIVVIAVAYSGGLDAAALAAAGGFLASIAWLRRLGVRAAPVFVLLAAGAWLATRASGAHPTIAGVGLAFLVPRHVGERLEHDLHPWAIVGIAPLFALANAGVHLGTGAFAGDRGAVAGGVVLGLVVGKLLGVSAFAWAATRLRIAKLPAGTSWAQFAGVAALSGIGLTVSLFIAGLAFDDPVLTAAARTGVLCASVVAALLGAVVLQLASRLTTAGPA